jgi:tetratricopeptide (TPR) repeat protein
VANLGRILAGKKKELTYVPLAVRSVKQPPLMLSPREGKLLMSPVLEWAGSDRLRYTIRVLGPQGMVWEQGNLPRGPLPYPPAAPRLLPGVAYRWELEARDFAPQRGQFTILRPQEIAKVRESLDALAPSALSGYPKNTVTLMRAGFLFEQELYAEARNELQVAIAADPDEPSLHLMLGHVYERTGLKELAAEEFDEAQFLVSSRP